MSHARSLATAFAILIGGAAPVAVAEESKPKVIEIPLKEIWAYDMPGTRKMNDSKRKGQFVQPEGKIVEAIRRALADPASGDKENRAKPAFAVRGAGVKALEEAHKVLVGDEEPQQSFSNNSDLSVVFFARPSPAYVHLTQVTREGNDVKIRYKFIPHATRHVTEHLALIPLTEAPSGRIEVKIIQEEVDDRLGRVDIPVA